MKILAVEFSSEVRSVALLENGETLGHRAENGGRRVIGMVGEILQQAGIEREEVEVIVVGLGPGSYTGIRGAIAFAQGWQLGLEVKLLGISSAECLAARAALENITGRVNVAIDAQRNEFYVARYEIEAGQWRLIEPLRLASVAEIEARAAAGEKIAGPDLGPWFPGAINLYPDAAMLGKLSIARTDYVAGDKLEPIYLRETAFKKAPPPRLIS
ncbi:MAG TPA: tRNA (adenosine(37)-N6)-threonylcarbamoyltransferase complex dimerization subunit type 1 TsaB [Verrucomicrobiae bacterium]|jgi:tRNA threonylcarbamoyladenosine biosynthesis protein TsaB|nr:tRNA (adenosine(37)-N6)-threonylcarbamoyltransferase complex dimerization subunit type 1 TsaB [Verrucomicrobiae bacterium]